MTRIKTHPGAVLAEELEARGLSANKFAAMLGVPTNRICLILGKQRGITPDTAIRLGEFFGNTPEFWLNMQAAHDLSITEVERGAEIRAQVRRPHAA